MERVSLLAPWQERLALLGSRGGASAAAYLLIRRVARVDLFKVLTLEFEAGGHARGDPTFRLLELRDLQDIERCDADLLATLDSQCGHGVAAIVQRGGRVYAAVGANGVLCQLTIDTHFSPIDTPCNLVVELGPGDCFLSFLYTPPESRRGGWAKKLVAAVVASLASEGLRRCHCHVQATNVRSLRTFQATGWRTGGVLAATPGRQFLGYRVSGTPGLRFRAVTAVR